MREVRRGLRKLTDAGRVHGADVDPDCLAAGFVDAFWRMPRLSDLTTDALIGYCREHDIRMIVPTRDGELAWFAERRAALAAAGVAVMAKRRHQGGENQQADRHAEQPVEVLGPHQRRVELRRIEAGRQLGRRGRRNPRPEATRPVGTTKTGARRAHQPPDQNQQIGHRRRPQRERLE